MRYLLFAAAAVLLPQASVAEPADSTARAISPAVEKPRPPTSGECRRVTSYKAESDLAWRGDGVAPKKLTELPPAEGYMAVYRTINGCEVPMTVVEYRTGRR